MESMEAVGGYQRLTTDRLGSVRRKSWKPLQRLWLNLLIRVPYFSIDNDVCPQTSDERCHARASPFEETALSMKKHSSLWRVLS